MKSWTPVLAHLNTVFLLRHTLFSSAHALKTAESVTSVSCRLGMLSAASRVKRHVEQSKACCMSRHYMLNSMRIMPNRFWQLISSLTIAGPKAHMNQQSVQSQLHHSIVNKNGVSPALIPLQSINTMGHARGSPQVCVCVIDNRGK